MHRPRFHSAGLAVLVFLALMTGGCDWLAKPAGDPRREGNYQDGLQWIGQRRWDNARESFLHTLETNPQNLYAHLRLGDLYGNALKDPVLSRYHYSRYLELGRLANHGAEFHDQSALDGMRNAEVELARKYAEGMFRDQQQGELNALRRTNVALVERIEVLNHQIALLTQRLVLPTNVPLQMQATNLVRKFPAPPAANPLAPTNLVLRVPPSGPTKRDDPAPSTALRTHRVQSGETFAVVARQFGIKLASLQAANPGVNSRALKPGQMLVIPPR